MNKYEAELANMKTCYITMTIKNVFLMILTLMSIYITGSLWSVLILMFASSCVYDDFDGTKTKKDGEKDE